MVTLVTDTHAAVYRHNSNSCNILPSETCTMLATCSTLKESKLGSPFWQTQIANKSGQATCTTGKDAIDSVKAILAKSMQAADEEVRAVSECLGGQCFLPESACQNPGLLWGVGHSALDPHVAAVLLHLAQECCQQRALACSNDQNHLLLAANTPECLASSRD